MRPLLAATLGLLLVDMVYVERGYNPLRSEGLSAAYIAAEMVLVAVAVVLVAAVVQQLRQQRRVAR